MTSQAFVYDMYANGSMFSVNTFRPEGIVTNLLSLEAECLLAFFFALKGASLPRSWWEGYFNSLYIRFYHLFRLHSVAGQRWFENRTHPVVLRPSWLYFWTQRWRRDRLDCQNLSWWLFYQETKSISGNYCLWYYWRKSL